MIFAFTSVQSYIVKEYNSKSYTIMQVWFGAQTSCTGCCWFMYQAWICVNQSSISISSFVTNLHIRSPFLCRHGARSKFYFTLEKTAIETYEMNEIYYGNKALFCTCL
jgi:hypothetical protein